MVFNRNKETAVAYTQDIVMQYYAALAVKKDKSNNGKREMVKT